jgi:resuscitation-promoting factor RpfB
MRRAGAATMSMLVAALLCGCGAADDASQAKAGGRPASDTVAAPAQLETGGAAPTAAEPTVAPVATVSEPPVVDTASVETPLATDPAPLATPPPTTAAPDPAAVDSCLAYVELTTFLSDPAGVAIWDRAGGSESGLRSECTRLASLDPAAVAAMGAEVDVINARLEAAAATTTTTMPAPPPTTLPRIVPLADVGGECDPNYSGCVPVASDVDCAGGSGNGPAYVDGPVRVIGRDIYDLDGNDNDGIGCES